MPERDSISPNTGRRFTRWSEIGAEAADARIARVTAGASGLAGLPARRDALVRVSAALAAARAELVALTIAEVYRFSDCGVVKRMSDLSVRVRGSLRGRVLLASRWRPAVERLEKSTAGFSPRSCREVGGNLGAA